MTHCFLFVVMESEVNPLEESFSSFTLEEPDYHEESTQSQSVNSLERNGKQDKKIRNKTSYSCNNCSLKTKYKSSLHRHNFVKHKGPGNLKMRKDKAHQLNPQYKCSICSKGFVSNTSYKAHMDKHSGIKLKCAKCGTLFSRAFCSKRHSKYCHQRQVDRANKCGMCNAVLFDKQALKDHMIAIHNNAWLYSCSVCLKRLSGDRHFKALKKCKLNTTSDDQTRLTTDQIWNQTRH